MTILFYLLQIRTTCPHTKWALFCITILLACRYLSLLSFELHEVKWHRKPPLTPWQKPPLLVSSDRFLNYHHVRHRLYVESVQTNNDTCALAAVLCCAYIRQLPLMKSGHYTYLLTLQAKASTGKHSAVISRVSHASCDQKMVNVPFFYVRCFCLALLRGKKCSAWQRETFFKAIICYIALHLVYRCRILYTFDCKTLLVVFF